MEIIVKENDAIRAAYSWSRPMPIIFYLSILLGFLGIIAVGLWLLIPCAIFSCFFAVISFRHIRISSFTDEHIAVQWPRGRRIRYHSIVKAIDLSPYDYDYHYLVIVVREGLFLGRLNLCFIPVDQGIIEHLKTHGVKICNFWFWQEK